MVPTTDDQKRAVPKAKNKLRMKEFLRFVNFVARIKNKLTSIAPNKIETCCWVTLGIKRMNGMRANDGPRGNGTYILLFIVIVSW